MAGPVLACLFAALLCRRRPGAARFASLALLLALAAAAFVLLAWSDRPAGSRVVLVLDRPVAPGSPVAARVNAVLNHLAESGLAGYDVVVADLAAQPPAKSAAVAGETLASRPWRSGPWQPGRADLTATSAKEGEQAEAGIRLACRRLDAMPRLQRLQDTVCLHTRRVIVLATAPAAWADQRLNIGRLAAELRTCGATADLLVNPIEDPTPKLEILLDRPTLAPNAVPKSNAGFRLRLQSRRLDALRRDNLRRQEVPFRIECTLNQGSPERRERFRLQRQGQTRIGPSGALEVEVFYRDFLPKPLTLPRGFHLLTCTLTAEPGGTSQTATAERYLQVTGQNVLFVCGTGRRFPLSGDRQLLADVWDDLARWTGRWPAGVDFRGGEELPNFWDEGKLVQAPPTTPSPFLVVLHDLSDEAWEKAAPLLARWTQEGTHLLVCGVPADEPPRRKKLPSLPAFAAPAAGKGVWRFDRRPRLIFVRDASRLGRLPLAPSEPGRLSTSPEVEGLRFKPVGDELQDNLIRTVCELLGRQAPRAQGGAPVEKDYLQIGVWTATGPKAERGEDFARDLVLPSSVPDRVAPLLAVPPPWPTQLLPRPFVAAPPKFNRPARGPNEVGINDVVVLITYDGILQPRGRPGALAALLAQGATVLDVRIDSPFRDGANRGAGPPYSLSLDDYFKSEYDLLADTKQFPGMRPVSAEEARRRHVKLGTLRLTSTAVAGGGSSLDAIAKAIAAHVRDRAAPRGTLLARGRLDRFIDERIGPRREDKDGLLSRADAERAGAAPLRYQWLVPASGGAVYAWVCWPEGAQGPLTRRPAAVGGLAGRGQVLCLAYSLFEGAARRAPDGAEPFLGVDFAEYKDWPVDSRIFPRPLSNDIDLWGPQRVIDLATFSAALEPQPTETPLLRGVDVLDARGRLRFEVLRRLPADAAKAVVLSPLSAVGPKGQRLQEPLAPADLDEQRGRVYYELLPSQAEQLLGNTPKTNAPQNGRIEVAGATVFLKSRLPAPQADLDGLAEAAAVVRYSGGSEADRPNGLPLYNAGTRLPAALTFAALLAGLWGVRTARRLGRARQAKRLGRREASGLVLADAAGLVAQAGESLGKPSAALRAGAFAGYRPFEPGDRLESALRDDLILNAVYDVPVIPRIPLRIDDRSTRLLVVVNVGRGMRLPSPRGPAPKVAAAGAAAELLAELAWSRRAEVTVRLAGLTPPPPALGPLSASPGPGEVRRYISAGARRPARWSAPLGLVATEEGGSVVYVSDCLTEGGGELLRRAEAFEQDGGAAGAVLVYSPAEFRLLAFGFAPAAGMFSDRSEWSANDLAAAHRLLAERLRGAWDDTRGGLAVLSATLRAAQVLDVIRESRLMELLR
jgi:hypothetical protein